MTDHAFIRVPASTTNLGAGFDCVGVAIDRWLSAEAALGTAMSGHAIVRRAGTLQHLACDIEDDLLYRGFVAACRARGRPVPGGLELAVESEIPVARGLGSSAAALVAGARLADSMLELDLSREELATLCAGVEGHADNVAAAVFGGAMLVVPSPAGGEGHLYSSLAIHAGLAFAFAVPDFEVATAAARAALPETTPHGVAVAAAAKSAALVQGLAMGDGELLAVALDDVLHVPHRRALVEGYDSVAGAACAAGAFGATLSGSGPTIVAIGRRADAADIAAAMRERWAECGVTAEAFVLTEPVAAGRAG